MSNKNFDNHIQDHWSEMTVIFQNQFLLWLKMSDEYFDYLNDSRKIFLQNFQEQYGVGNENSKQILQVSKSLVNSTTKQTIKKTEEALHLDTLEGNWKHLMVDIQKQWSKLTNDNLSQINGSRVKLAGALQKNYGIARKEAEKQMKDWEDARVKTAKSSVS